MLISLINMTGHLCLAGVVLLAGLVWVLVISRRQRGGAISARWIPWTSLAAGPFLGMIFGTAEVFLFHPGHYPVSGDAGSMIGTVTFVSTVAGCVMSLTTALLLHGKHRSGR